MKKQIKNFSIAASFALLSVFFASCGSDWLTDFDTAKKSAGKSNKNIMLLFSGDDWDSASADYKKAVFNDSKFISAVKKDNVLVNIDFSQAEYAKTELPEDAGKKQVAEAKVIEENYKKKEALAKKLSLGQYPSLYILTKEGYYLTSIPCSEDTKNVEAFLASIDSHKAEMEKNLDAINVVRAASGVEKVTAIDALYENFQAEYLGPFEELVHQVPELDPENESGLVGKYLLYGAYFDSYNVFENSPEEASQCFERIATSPFLDTEQKQNAYYMAAYMLARGGVEEFDLIENLLQTSYDLDPDSEHAKGLMDAITAVRQMAETAKTDLSEFSEE